MCRKYILTLGLFLLALMPGSTAVQAQQAWVQLGCKDVDLSLDRDVVPVGARDGRYNAIRLRASGNAVQMVDLKVIYRGGEPDDIPVRSRIPENGTSGALDLRGRDRSIERIQLLYARVPNRRGRARLCVDGRQTMAASAPGPAWVQLGCRDVDLRVDHDTIQVGRRDGHFTAIRLRAAGNAVQMIDLKVIYGNGERDDIPVRARVPENGSSGVLDLQGRERSINRIDLLYARVPNPRGPARLCVDGRAAG